MKTIWIAVLAGTLVLAAHGATGGAPSPGREGMAASPDYALVILTREGSGCLMEQRVLRDVTSFLTGAPGPAVRVDQLESAEDREDRAELFLFFRAAPILSREGFLAFKLAAARREGDQSAHLAVTRAKFVFGEEGNRARLELDGQCRGILQAEMLFVPDVALRKGRFTCPEADLFLPGDVAFLPGYPVSGSLTAEVKDAPGANGRFLLHLDEAWKRELLLVSACADLLSGLERELSASTEYRYLWERRKVTPESLDRLAGALEGGQTRRYFVSCRLYGREGLEEITRPGDQSEPMLRQRISAVDPSGHITGGEIRIGVDRDTMSP